MRDRFALSRSNRVRTGVAKAIPDRPVSFRRAGRLTTLSDVAMKRSSAAGEQRLPALLEEE
jgi:hypothetical protein